MLNEPVASPGWMASAQPAIAASKISEFFVVTQHQTAEWLARQITILDLAAGDVDHELGETTLPKPPNASSDPTQSIPGGASGS
jgi:hypothetical protein